MKPRIYIRPAQEADVDRIRSFCANNPGPGARVGDLAQLAADQCLLQTSVEGQLAGVAGLDLGRRCVAGPWVPSRTEESLARRMLVATERLAAAYGMTQLIVFPSKNATDFFADSGYWKMTGGLAEGDGRPGMARSIIRRSTRFARRARGICAELGIPRDYGARHRLRLQPEAPKLVSIGEDIYGRKQRMTPRAASAWRRMLHAALADEVEFQPVSAFRTVDYQANLVRRKLDNGQSIEQILEVTAAPGYSEHHSGRAIDVTAPGFDVLEEPFEDSPAFEWLTSNAERFGFRLSYPRDNPHGVAYEPWHWCWRH